MSNEPAKLVSVSSLPLEDRAGKQYEYSLEPELEDTATPRVVTIAPSVWVPRAVLWCLSIGVIIIIVLYASRESSADTGSRDATTIILMGMNAAFLFGTGMVDVSADPSILRHGVAVRGTLVRGIVEDDDGPCYRLKYTYRIRARTMENIITVTAEQYAIFTTGNPYITILYDPKNPEVSKPYFQITAASLST